MMDQDVLLIAAKGRTMLVAMNRRSSLGYRPRIASMTLYPKDLNVKQEDVEQRGLRSMTQTTNKEKIIDFVTRAKKKEGIGRSIS